jgi:phospholipid transport system substrate-binding protein
MLNRRIFLSRAGVALAGAASVTALPAGFARPAWASPSDDKAAAFIKSIGDKLVASINAPGSLEQRRVVLTGIIDAAVDVDGVARFCLGRFVRIATAEEQQQYLTLFHSVLVNNISAKMGEYQGVKFTVGIAQTRDVGEVVSSVVERPNNPPANVQWVVANADSAPKIIDVIAEGTSLRVTQRDEYAAFLAHNNNSVRALIGAMRDQVSKG